MRTQILITSFLLFGYSFAYNQPLSDSLQINFLGYAVSLPGKVFTQQGILPVNYREPALRQLIEKLSDSSFARVAERLTNIKTEKQLDDWLFYQLIRRTAQQIIPKKKDYLGYTVCKGLLLQKTGYSPLLRLSDDKILLYVKSRDTVYNIPFLTFLGEQYVCLNYHDYGYRIDFEKESFRVVATATHSSSKNFSYKITHLPNFSPNCYTPRDIQFYYQGQLESISLSYNTEMQNYFNNYPVIDYRYQFSIPFSSQTYRSLIPFLQQKIAQRDTLDGVDYLMKFVRNAFVFGKDADQYGLEKRFSPEETLLADKSDCEDRSALFFALVKELYRLPMIVLSYPQHVTVAVKLRKTPKGNPLMYNGSFYSICEVTPQKKELALGDELEEIKNQPFEVVVEYTPQVGSNKKPPQE